MESAEPGLNEELRDQVPSEPNDGHDGPPRRMPSGTLAPPVDVDIDVVDLATLQTLLQRHETAHEWRKVGQTLRRMLDVEDLAEREAIEIYARLAEVESEQGEVDAAIDAWRNVLALDATDLRALDALQSLFERHERWTDAIDVIEKSSLVLDDELNRIQSLLQMASIYEDKLDDLERAAEVYERVRGSDPSNATAAARLEAIQARQGHWAELVESMLERSETAPEVAQQIAILRDVAGIYERELADEESAFYVLQAAFGRDAADETTARELERLAGAIDGWRELVDETSKRASEIETTDPAVAAELWLRVGRWYRDKLAHVEYATHSVEQALRLQPQHAGALAARASLEPSHEQKTARYLEQAKSIDGAAAIAAYEQVLAHDPSSRDALDALEQLHRRAEAWQPLIAILARRAELTGDEAEIVRLRVEIATIYDVRLLDATAAIAAHEKVRELEPGNLVALCALEALYEQAGQHEKCLAILDALLDAAPSDADRIAAYERMAAIWEERFGKLDRAAEAYEQVVEIDATNISAYHLLERLYQQAGRYEALVATYRNHIAALSDDAMRIELNVALGKICETRLQSYEAAIEAYEAALALDPDEPQALAAVGRLYEQTADWYRAVDALGRLVELDRDPRKHELHYRIGRIQHGKLDDRGAAESSWLRGLALDAEHLPTLQALIELYTDRGDWREAVKLMARAANAAVITVDKVRLLVQAATLHAEKLDAADDAKRLYAQAIALDPEHVDAGRPLAEMYFAAGAWSELSPVIDMLCRKAGQHELYVRAARCASELGETTKALGYYETAIALDAAHLPSLIGRADLQFELRDWERAKKSYQAIIVQDRTSVSSHNRLGRIRLALGERRPALAMFAKALELDPHHRDTLEAVIDLHTQQRDWKAVVTAKRALMEISDERDKTRLANEIATIYRDRLQNASEATSAYLDALATAPEDRQLLQKVLDLHIETKQWRPAIEIIERFIALESDAFKKGVYFHAAATLCRDELQAIGEAVELYDRALDCFFSQPERLDDQKLPRALLSFEAIDRILTAQRDWKAQESAYREMIERLPEGRFHELRVRLHDALGEIYRSRLKHYVNASGAFEIAQLMDPDNKLRPNGTDRAEILAELHVLAGVDHADKAIEQHQRMLTREPFKYDSYTALARIYRDTQQYDKHWCLCSTLAFLKKAAPDELKFYEQYKPRGLVKAKAVMSPQTWATLAHPDENRHISAILGACWQSVAAMKAFPHKDLGLKREERLQSDELMFTKLLDYAARVLSVRLPDVYLVADNKPVDIQFANASQKSELCPSFVVRSHLLQGKSERELAFALTRKLAFMRPEYFLRMLLPTTTELAVVVLSAVAMFQPRFPVPPNMATLVQQYLPEMQKRMPAGATDSLAGGVRRFVEAAPALELAKWGHAVDGVTHRAGFVVCGDLETAVRMIAVEPTVVDGPSIKDKVRELVLFSIGEAYFKARAQLGLTIAT